MNILELEDSLKQIAEQQNKASLAYFDGFSPEDMYHILYYPFSERCPIQLNFELSGDSLTKSPLMMIVLDFLDVLENDGVKLTPKGNLPRKVIEELYNKKYLPDQYIDKGITKLRTEENWIALHSVKLVLTLAGITKKYKGKLQITKKYFSALKEKQHSIIFKALFQTFTTQFNWAYNDRFEHEQTGQLGFLFMLYLINKYGVEYQDLKYYTEKYFKAFPMLVCSGQFFQNMRYNESEHCVHTRFFDRFAQWFGFADILLGPEKYFDRTIQIRRTDLLTSLFMK